MLSRISRILRPDGHLLVETHAIDRTDETLSVRFWHDHRPTGPSFPWALVGQAALSKYAAQTGFCMRETWHDNGRAFALLSLTSPARYPMKRTLWPQPWSRAH